MGVIDQRVLNRLAPGSVERATTSIAADQKNDVALHIGTPVDVLELILDLEVYEVQGLCMGRQSWSER